MWKTIKNFINRQKFDYDVFKALIWKKGDEIQVVIKKTENGYFAKIVNFTGSNVVTEAETGQELIEMVNEALYDYLNIPEVYRDSMGYFLPPEHVREEMKIKIPEKYLNKNLGLCKA